MMRVHFVVNTTGLTGGIRVVFEYANRLQARGHQVKVFCPFDLSAQAWPAGAAWRAAARRVKYALFPHVTWFDLEVPVVRVPRVTDRYVPDADAIVATANETADWVAALGRSKGVKFYLIQHFESWTRDVDLVEKTWKLPMHKIVIASWLERRARELGQSVAACITNGVNTRDFHCEPRPPHFPPRLLMMVHTLPWKGTQDGLEALRILRGQGRQFEATLFGESRRCARLAGAAFVRAPQRERLRRLYCAHDIFISPSWSEGCQLPPMEAMACGCAVVATNVGGIPDYAIAGDTAFVVEPRQPQALAAAIARLLEAPELLRRVAARGQEHIQQFTWERATEHFERTLMNHAAR